MYVQFILIPTVSYGPGESHSHTQASQAEVLFFEVLKIEIADELFERRQLL